MIIFEKFLHIDDYDLAQQLLDKQLDTKWESLFSGFAKEVFPSMQDMLGEKMSYYWTLWQSEIAKDYIFESPQSLNSLMDNFLRHAITIGTYDRVLKYMGRPVYKNDQPHPLSNPELMTKVKLWHDGMRIRHWLDKNSVKLYNEQNVLRFEITMNNPQKFLVHRHKEGQDKSEPKKLLPMCKGIADINVRAKVSGDRLNCFSEQIATVSDKTPIGNLLADIGTQVSQNGKKFRAV